jgi:uncharacterized protein (DUF58 family)
MPVTTVAELLSPETLVRIDSYALLARVVVEGFLAGMHRSLYQGFGSEFFQYRTYVPGDDPKYVDWKVFGRLNRFYTKVFQEETNLNCTIVLDASASMGYQGQRSVCGKLRYASMLAACLAYLARRQGDSVGLCAYAEALSTWVPPALRHDGAQRVFTALQALQAGGVANHRTALNYVAENLRRRGLVVLIGDFHGLEDELEALLHRLRFAHHDCIVFQVLDRDELDLPFQRTVRFVDSEDGSELTTAPDLIRAGYEQTMTRFLERIRSICLSQQVDYLQVQTSENLGNLLAAYLHRREALSG